MGSCFSSLACRLGVDPCILVGYLWVVDRSCMLGGRWECLGFEIRRWRSPAFKWVGRRVERGLYEHPRGAHPIVFFSIMHESDKYMLLGMFMMIGRSFMILGDFM